MMKSYTLARAAGGLVRPVLLVTLAVMSAACTGSDSPEAPLVPTPPAPTEPARVTGISIPSSVAVVTATNAE